MLGWHHQVLSIWLVAMGQSSHPSWPREELQVSETHSQLARKKANIHAINCCGCLWIMRVPTHNQHRTGTSALQLEAMELPISPKWPRGSWDSHENHSKVPTVLSAVETLIEELDHLANPCKSLWTMRSSVCTAQTQAVSCNNLLYSKMNWYKAGLVVHICNVAPGRLRQEESGFEGSLGYRVRSCLNKQKRNSMVIVTCYWCYLTLSSEGNTTTLEEDIHAEH